MTFSAGAAAPATDSHDRLTAARASGVNLTIDLPNEGLLGPDGKAAVIVMLSGEPATVAYARALEAGGRGPLALTAAGNASRQAVQQLEAQQNEFMSALRGRAAGAVELYRVQRALNAVALRMAPEEMARVRGMRGVDRVEFIDVKVPDLGTSVSFLRTAQVWEGTPLGIAGAKGEGISIGIIDSGVDYQHPNFGGTGVLADYQANNRAVITEVGAAAFPTARVRGGFDFTGDAFNNGTVATPTPDPDPMDCGGHGSHVAGIAAGGGVNTNNTPYSGPLFANTDYAALKIGPGVAPRAELYALRVFGCGGSTPFTALAIDWATDPNDDGDLGDRLDVINMSLGSNFGLGFDESAAASDNATLSGMIVVASAGNAADTINISGSPGAGGQVISVANSLDSGVAGPLRINAPVLTPAFRTTGAASFGVSPPFLGLSAEVVVVQDGVIGPANPPAIPAAGTVTDGCETPFTNAADVAGKIAFLDRGYCGFKVKARNAELAGAIGVIIGNVASSGTPGTAPGMADDITVPAITIPTVSLNLTDANAVRTNSPGVNVTLFQGADTVAGSSSRGGFVRNGASTYLKPDIAAPGTSIISTQTGVTCTAVAQGCIVPNGSGFIANGATLNLSGTSMAAPHVAGAVAILRQLNPSLLPAQIKAIALSTASHDVTTQPGGTGLRYPASRIGSGRVDVASGAITEIYAYNDDVPGAGSVVFDQPIVGPTTASHNVRIVNRTAAPQSLTLSLDTVANSPGVSFAITSPTTIALAPGASAVAVVQMTATPADMDRFREPTLVELQNETIFGVGPYPRSYLAEESALLKVSKGSTEVSRVAVYLSHRPHSSMHATGGVGVDDPATGVVNLTLAGQDVCTGTLVAGVCTGDFATDHVSLVSPFELQVRGERDANVPGFANIRHVGVNYDPTNDLYLFGVETWGKWESASIASVNICLDLDRNGTYDRVLWSSNANNRALSTGSGNDIFFDYIFTPPTGVALVGDHNVLSADVVETGVHDNNVQILNFTGAALSLAAGGGSFNYAVATCPWFNPLCVRLTDPAVCDRPGFTYQSIAGPFTYNAAARGITSAGGLSYFGAANLPVLIPDLAGTVLPVGYNQANLSANGAHSILLLHHHNEGPEVSDVIVVIDRVFLDGFED